MLMDERLERIEQLVSDSLNDNATAQKAGAPIGFLNIVLIL
jgi:hypothetical protein